jgi:hypothetical protein
VRSGERHIRSLRLEREVGRATLTPIPMTPAAQVAGFIAKFDPQVAKPAKAVRAKLRKRLPTAIELVYDNYNALALGFGPTERTSECVLSVAVYARGVNVYFMRSAALDDPDGMLEAPGLAADSWAHCSEIDLEETAPTPADFPCLTPNRLPGPQVQGQPDP